MATHFVYDEPDKTQLSQGDVLQRTSELVELLNQFHPHYAVNPDYKFFAVLTQSCDLVRRGSRPLKSPYITIAAARTIEETLLREARKVQDDWQQEAKVIGGRDKDTLLKFLQRVIDNNEPGYFYLHADQSVGIHRTCCVVLPLAVSVRAQHYDMLLDAKIAQIKDTFQAKLGWLVGNLYGRVGTTEWDKEFPDNPVKDVARKMLDDTLQSVTDEQIKEGISELRKDNSLESKTAAEIFAHIRKKKILSRGKKFEKRAIEVSKAVPLINPIQGLTVRALDEGDALKRPIREILVASGVPEDAIDGLVDRLIGAIHQRISDVMTDVDLPGREDVVLKFIRGLLQDPQTAQILR